MKNEAYIARPNTFKIEMTKGCNLKCTFCPVHTMPELQRQYEYMTPARLKLIMESLSILNEDARIELTRRGEPTLNPDIMKNLRIMRKAMPRAQISMFTNGTTILKQGLDLVVGLIDNGVNILNIDCYNNTYDRFAKIVGELVEEDEIAVMDFRKFSAYKRHPRGYNLRVVNLVPDIADPARLVSVRKIHNAAGNSDVKIMKEKYGIAPLKEPLKKNCAKPYRELNVNFDGSVPICCEDWRAQCIMGNLTEKSARAIWYGDFHLEILRDLYRKDRSGAPCDKCTFAGGYYLGFLQDPFKKKVK